MEAKSFLKKSTAYILKTACRLLKHHTETAAPMPQILQNMELHASIQLVHRAVAFTAPMNMHMLTHSPARQKEWRQLYIA